MTPPEVDFLVYTHRWSPLQVRLIESIARHTKRHQYSIHVVQLTGSCSKNMNRVWRRTSAEYAVLIDEDVQILQDGWLDSLIQALERDHELGVVGCQDLKTDPKQSTVPESMGVDLDYRNWIPAYVMAFKRARVPFLRFDEAIPGDMGMSDLDACLQIAQEGLKVAINRSVIVYHPTRDDDATRIMEQRPLCSTQNDWFPQQVQYMLGKWGENYRRLLTR